jgi:hypothetical protein
MFFSIGAEGIQSLIKGKMAKVAGVIASLLMPIVLLSTGFRNAQNGDARTPLEIKRLVTDSPWAKPVTLGAKGDDWVEGSNQSSLSKAPVDRTGPSSVGADVNPNRAARSQSVVRWDSSSPVQEACAKAGMEPYAFSCYSKIMLVSGQSEKFDALAKDFYILTVSNYPKAALPRRDQDAPQHSSESNAALERLGERLRSKTLLKRKAKESIAPEKVLVLPAGQALLVVVFFSRSASISPDDGNVVVELIQDPVEIRVRFNLKKMTVNGRLEL